MNEGPYYEKKDSLSYIVYFNIILIILKHILRNQEMEDELY